MRTRFLARGKFANIENVEGRAQAIEHVVLADESVDRVMSNYALHHLRDEDKALAVTRAARWLAPGGRLVVISYHSGEDSLVKATLRDAATGGCTCPPQLPCGCGAVIPSRLAAANRQSRASRR